MGVNVYFIVVVIGTYNFCNLLSWITSVNANQEKVDIS